MSYPTIVCLTPVKNEAWILERFLKCTSIWADHIIIADQQSTDKSREIANQCPKVTLIENSSLVYSELERQKILIDAARQLPEPRLLITLDADEFLTANFLNSPEWMTTRQVPVGTVIQFQRVEVQPDLSTYWQANGDFAWGFMDDGSGHAGTKIHSTRVPVPSHAPKITLREIKVLHYQCVDWERMRSKHRWYQCWERLNQPWRRAIDIYRQYHHIDIIPPNRIQPLPKEWLSEYEQQGIDMTSIYREPTLWWDREVLAWLDKYGADTFKREAIWDVDWFILSQTINPDKRPVKYRDPRSKFERYVHRLLSKTQPNYSRFHVRLIEKILGLWGW